MKAVTGRQHHAANAGRGRSAARFADALDGKAGLLGVAGAFFQVGDARQIGIEQVEIGELVREQSLVGEA